MLSTTLSNLMVIIIIMSIVSIDTNKKKNDR